MRHIHYIALLVIILFLGTAVSAQVSGKYAPFTVDDEFTIRLNIPDAGITKKYESLFKKHERDVTSVSDWDGIIQQIIASYDTDLLLDDGFSIDRADNAIIVSAGAKENVDRFMKAVKPTITNLQKLDVFITDLDKTLKKK